MADVNIGTIVDSPSVAEDVSMAIDQTPTAYVADVISLSEYAAMNIAGEGSGEVEDSLSTSEGISGASLFTKSILPRRKVDWSGFLNVSVSGTFVGTVTLQRSYDRGSTWLDLISITTITETFLTDNEIGVWYRLGIKTGDYVSGTAVCRLGIGGQ